MGIFDYPAIIDYILTQTNNSQINFIGHSQGTTSLLVLLSMKTDYNRKINQAHLFAPPAFRKKLPKSLIVYNFLRFLVKNKYNSSSHYKILNERKIMQIHRILMFVLIFFFSSSLSRFKDGHEEIRFLELRRLFRFGDRVSNTICRDNDLLIFMVCKRLIRITFGGNRSQEVDIETVSVKISQYLFT